MFQGCTLIVESLGRQRLQVATVLLTMSQPTQIRPNCRYKSCQVKILNCCIPNLKIQQAPCIAFFFKQTTWNSAHLEVWTSPCGSEPGRPGVWGDMGSRTEDPSTSIDLQDVRKKIVARLARENARCMEKASKEAAYEADLLHNCFHSYENSAQTTGSKAKIPSCLQDCTRHAIL